VKKIGIITNPQKDENLLLTKEIVSILNCPEAKLFMPEDFSNSDISGVDFLSNEEIFSTVDFIVTVGGDGTILRIAEKASKNSISVIGINLGRLGFMAELEPNEIGLLSKIITDDFTIESRMMLDVSIIRDGKTIENLLALNEVVVGKGSVSKIAELELYCNDTFICPFHSDGLIVSTPTGSTAYSLSAGGAIIDPTLNCMLLTPVCPHSFTNSRPIVFSPSSILQIKDVQSEENTYLTVDGRINLKLNYLDTVEVRVSDKTTELVKIKNTEFYDRVNRKIAERK